MRFPHKSESTTPQPIQYISYSSAASDHFCDSYMKVFSVLKTSKQFSVSL